MWNLLTAIIWITSLLTLPSYANGFWFPKDMAWMVGSLLIISSPMWNPPSRYSVHIPALGWFLAWSMLTFSWIVVLPQITVAQSGVGMDYAYARPWNVFNIFPTLTVIGSILAVDALVRHTDVPHRWHKVALHLVRIATILSLIFISSSFGINPLKALIPAVTYIHWSWVNLFGNPTVFGNFLAIILPLCLMFSPLRYRLGSFIVILIALAETFSVSSLAAGIAGSLAVLAIQRKWKLFFVLTSISLAGAYYFFHSYAPNFISGYFSTKGRIGMWQTALTYWSHNPFKAWIGYGAGSVAQLTVMNQWSYGFLHNDWLEILFEFGIIGFSLIALSIGQILNRMRSFDMTGASSAWIGAGITYALLMCTSYLLKMGTLLMLGVLIVSAVLVHCKPKERLGYVR